MGHFSSGDFDNIRKGWDYLLFHTEITIIFVGKVPQTSAQVQIVVDSSLLTDSSPSFQNPLFLTVIVGFMIFAQDFHLGFLSSGFENANTPAIPSIGHIDEILGDQTDIGCGARNGVPNVMMSIPFFKVFLSNSLHLGHSCRLSHHVIQFEETLH